MPCGLPRADSLSQRGVPRDIAGWAEETNGVSFHAFTDGGLLYVQPAFGTPVETKQVIVLPGPI